MTTLEERAEYSLRVPPHSLEAEQAVLGGIVMDTRAYGRIDAIVGEDDFYTHQHRVIFNAMTRLAMRRQPIDIVTLKEELDREGGDEVDRGYLIALAKDSGSAANIKHYAEIVREKSRARRAIEILTDATSGVYAGEEGVVEAAITQLMTLSAAKQNYSYTLKQALLAARDRLDAVLHDEVPAGVDTGIEQFDRRFGGLHDGDLIVLAARPSVGKTAAMLNIARAASVPVGVVSGEQGHMQLGQRHFAMEARVSLADIIAGRVDETGFSKLMGAAERLVDLEYYIYDRPSPSLAEIQGIARYWKQNHGLGLLLVDYLQRMKPNWRLDKRHEQVAEDARGLKELARELNIPVVALAQVNRDCEKRADKRPMMGDLADSSAIEKEADQIITLYRDEVYNPESPDKGIAEWRILKTRNGPTGKIKTAWQGEFLRFENLDERYVA